MINPVYTHAITNLSQFLGAPSELESGNGARFRNGSNYLLTIYHSNLAGGNRAEIAFKPGSLQQIRQICSSTGHPVNPDRRHNWPRVGITNIEEVNTIADMIRTSVA